MPDVIYPALHGKQHCPGGEDPIPCWPSSSTVWAHISTENSGWEYQGGGADDNVDYYSIWISDAALSGGFFDYEVEAGAGQFGDDIGFLLMKQSGIYTFTQQLLTSDLDATAGSHEAFHYQTRLNVLGGTPGTTWGGDTGRFPGQIGTPPLLQDREQLWISQAGGDDLWLNRSWTIPIRHPNPGTERRTCEMRVFHAPQTTDPFWTIRVWVTRIGDLDWEGGAFNNLANATWAG